MRDVGASLTIPQEKNGNGSLSLSLSIYADGTRDNIDVLGFLSFLVLPHPAAHGSLRCYSSTPSLPCSIFFKTLPTTSPRLSR